MPSRCYTVAGKRKIRQDRRKRYKIGENIRKLRLKSGFTQEKLAGRLCVTFQAVSKWENGANTPDISLLPALASVFGVTIDSLFSDGDIDAWTGAEMIKDDGVLRVVQLQGTRVLKASPLSGDDPSFEIVFPRNCNDRTQYFKVEVFGRLIADGPINGDVVCHENVYCDDINGDVTCGGSLKCDDLNGNLQCAGNIECGSISVKRDLRQLYQCKHDPRLRFHRMPHLHSAVQAEKRTDHLKKTGKAET